MLQARAWYRALAPSLLLLYLILAFWFPSHWHVLLLGVAVILAARTWEVAGGLVSAVLSGLALAFGLWRLEGRALLHQPLALAGFGWAWAATGALGLYVGYLTRQTREMLRSTLELRQAQQRLTALHAIATSLSATLDISRLLEIILEQLGQLWGYDYGSILLVDEPTGDLVLTAARGYAREPGARLSAGSGVCGAVVQTGEPMLIPDVAMEPRYLAGVANARSEIAVPLKWEGRVIGVLNVESPVPNAYGPADLSLLSTVAEQAAAAIENARLHQKTRQLAITDPHTALYNYRHFQEQVAAMVRDAQLTGIPCSLIILDIDHFKRVNDTYGHPTGDEILRQAARVLRESVRHEDLLFRYGGEEFAVALPGASGEAALLVAERIRERVAAHTFVTRSGRPLDFALTASLGVGCYPRDAMSQVDLVLAADRALYAAKASGRNRAVAANAPAGDQATA